MGQKETSVTFGLNQGDLDPSSKSLWDIEFELVYTVSLDESELRCDFEVHNPGLTSSFECHTLLHTYFHIQVGPLQSQLNVGSPHLLQGHLDI